jgi:probable F420-dependent oxidoreductase
MTGAAHSSVIRLGAKVPNSGPLPTELGMTEMARELEEAGFDSLWVSDHIVMPKEIESRYPFAADGRATWSSSTPYFDAFIALAMIAAATERVSFGTAVLVLPLRHPVVAAKQLASLDVASGGRLQLGVGAGWLREEFEALAVPFESRGARLEEWIELLRECWTGTPQPRQSSHYTLPSGVLCLPTPVHDIPILVGGHSGPALRRAGALGDGWLGQQSLDRLDPAEISTARAAVEAAARAAGRDPERMQVVLRIVDAAGRSDELAPQLAQLAKAGVDEVIVDVDWGAGDPTGEHERLRSAVA